MVIGNYLVILGILVAKKLVSKTVIRTKICIFWVKSLSLKIEIVVWRIEMCLKNWMTCSVCIQDTSGLVFLELQLLMMHCKSFLKLKSWKTVLIYSGMLQLIYSVDIFWDALLHWKKSQVPLSMFKPLTCLTSQPYVTPSLLMQPCHL